MPEWELMNDFSQRLGDLMGMKILKAFCEMEGWT